MANGNGVSEKELATKQVFTTGEAAALCKVSQQTIIRCFDNGRLGGFRVPGSRFRRIPRGELIRFMKDNEIPTGLLEGKTRRILVVDDEHEILELFQDALGADPRFEIETASTGYDAGLLTERFKPHLIVLDYMLPDINGNLVCQRIRANPMHRNTKILFISGVVSEKEIADLKRAGADDFIKKPFNIQQVIERISDLVDV